MSIESGRPRAGTSGARIAGRHALSCGPRAPVVRVRVRARARVNARSVVALGVEAHAVALEQQRRRLRQHPHVESGTIPPVAIWPRAMDGQLTHLPLHQAEQPCGVPRNSGGSATLALPHSASLGMLRVARVTPPSRFHASQPHATHEATAGDAVVYVVIAATECLVQHVHLLRVERRVVARHGRVDASPRARSLPPKALLPQRERVAGLLGEGVVRVLLVVVLDDRQDATHPPRVRFGFGFGVGVGLGVELAPTR
eukprot:scaffold55094_cov57-Phaeocystis_antarctica.AAC.4